MGIVVIVEVIAVGTELLIGQIINSNVATIGQRLADEGFDAHWQVTVGDNVDRLVEAIRTAADRADAVILTGGIGPTQDDMTRDALCVVGGREMARDEAHAAAIEERLLRTRGSVAENTLRMADYPAGAHPLPNAKGVALGVAMEHDGTWMFAMPGVPTEMVAMLDDQVLPRLRAANGEPAVLKSRVLRTYGYGESQISEMFDDLYSSANPSIAFLINGPEVRMRITAKAIDEEAVDTMISGFEEIIRSRLGDAVFGTDEDTIDVLLARLLREKEWKVATVEASTLGMVAAELGRAGGVDVLAGGVTVTDRATDADVATEAEMMRDLCAIEADVVVAISNIAGVADGNNSTREVGVAITTPDGSASRTIRLLGDDDRARRFAVPGALHTIRLAITGSWWSEE